MRWFLCNILLFLGLVLGSIVVVFYLADGTTDAFYKKFTSPKQSSLIIGTSRAAQGIQPEVINLHMGVGVYNYAFSRVHTPYGEAYYENIKRKLKTSKEERLFILEVNPWTISTTVDDEKSSTGFKEDNSFIKKVECVDCNSNFEYLISCYQSPYRDLILNRFFSENNVKVTVNDNGWCEVLFQKSNTDYKKIEAQTNERYRLRSKEYIGISEQRLAYLERLIVTLQSYGHVYLVRLPVADGMLRIETEYMPDFDHVITRLSETYKVPYINAMPERHVYGYTDGHHLDILSGKRFSEYLVNQIETLH